MGLGGANGSVRLYLATSSRQQRLFRAHDGRVTAVAFAPGDRTLASAGEDGLVKLWEVAGQKELKTLKGHDGMVTAVVFAPDNASIYSIGLADRTLRQWNVASGMEMKKMGPTPDDLYGLAWSPDKKSLATSGYGGNVIVWDLMGGKPASTRKLKFGAYCVVFTPDGKVLITGHDNHICYVTPL